MSKWNKKEKKEGLEEWKEKKIKGMLKEVDEVAEKFNCDTATAISLLLLVDVNTVSYRTYVMSKDLDED